MPDLFSYLQGFLDEERGGPFVLTGSQHFLLSEHLVDLGIVNNRVTLRRWISAGDFPAPLKLGVNSVAWRATDVADWFASRAAEREAPCRLG